MIIPLATHEYSGRGADIEIKSMAELLDTIGSIWPLIPIAFVLVFISWLFLKKRILYDVENENNLTFFKSFRVNDESECWFYFQDGDKWYTKVWIVILWIITIIAAIGGVYTIFQIIWRILIGVVFTFIEWVLFWLLSIGFLLVAPAIPATLVYTSLEKHVKWLAIFFAAVLFIGGVSLIIYFWEPIVDWEWTFPEFPSFSIYRF